MRVRVPPRVLGLVGGALRRRLTVGRRRLTAAPYGWSAAPTGGALRLVGGAYRRHWPLQDRNLSAATVSEPPTASDLWPSWKSLHLDTREESDCMRGPPS